ncbi:hypothetical protein Ahy_A07g034388 [Arachis hypogaea]|uniref:Uncharacterized protein n=1 Tax=Arachis hypogaea TaxID=3818 RepID=A0A445CBQ8_ARAHY|nr:hypothetical protein Ahy_A07g034388 [Arachis hypogaea]
MDPPIRDSESNPKLLSENKDVVFIDTNLDTHLAVLVSDHDTVSDLKGVPKRIKICCGVTAAIVILLVVILVILIFTVFKQKDPIVTLQSVKVKEASLVIFPIGAINVSLGILLTVEKPNHRSFSYHNSTAILIIVGSFWLLPH